MNIEERTRRPPSKKAGSSAGFHACGTDRGTPGGDSLNWKEIVAALKSVKYDGDVVIESFTTDVKVIARAAAISGVASSPRGTKSRGWHQESQAPVRPHPITRNPSHDPASFPSSPASPPCPLPPQPWAGRALLHHPQRGRPTPNTKGNPCSTARRPRLGGPARPLARQGEGAITGYTTAVSPLKQNTFLVWTNGTVSNFELHFKYRIHGGNSGVQYRSELMDPAQFVVGGYQADIDATPRYTGILYEERGRGIL